MFRNLEVDSAIYFESSFDYKAHHYKDDTTIHFFVLTSKFQNIRATGSGGGIKMSQISSVHSKIQENQFTNVRNTYEGSRGGGIFIDNQAKDVIIAIENNEF